MAELECPKCQSPMRSYERSGLQVDQCSGCRGIFLDRGELEKLIDAEGEYYERTGGGRDDPRKSEHREEHRDDYRGGGLNELGGLGGLLGGGKHGSYGKHGGHRKKHKKDSFLSELFD
jgi:Zn-finger nucleic acid-binding protein